MFVTIDQNPVLEVANGGLSFGKYTAVALTENGVTNTSAGDIPLGILLNDDLERDSVTVQIDGGGYWLTGESITAGDFLSAGLSGTAVKATTGSFAFAQALENASEGSAAKVKIVRAGKL